MTPDGAEAAPLGPRFAPVAGKPARLDRGLARRFGAAAGIMLAGLALAEAWRLTGTTPAVRYATSEVSRGTIARTVTGSGTVNPVTTIQVGWSTTV